jgi:hypothetical protein
MHLDLSAGLISVLKSLLISVLMLSEILVVNASNNHDTPTMANLVLLKAVNFLLEIFEVVWREYRLVRQL